MNKVRLKAFLLFLFIPLVPTPKGSGDTLTGEVRGSVLNVEGSMPLEGASITLTGADLGWKKQAKTDIKGS